MSGKDDDTVQSGSVSEDPVPEGSEIGSAGLRVLNAEYVEESLIGQFYTGEVVSVHDGYCYIGKVKRGYETINTNGDVFCPGNKLALGAKVKFIELNTDPRRPGKHRTEQADVLNDELAVVSSVEQKALALMNLTQPTDSPYHRMAKEIDAGDVEQAAKNLPFKEMLATFVRLTRNLDDSAEVADEFLRSTFPSLGGFDVSFSVDGDADEAAEEAKIQSAISGYKEAGMFGQVTSLTNEWNRFKGARKVFELMKRNGTLRPDMIIPIKYLPEMLVACPVWYMDGKVKLTDQRSEGLPGVDWATDYFCKEVGTRNFASLYQIYNLRNRPFGAFSGRDIIPPALLQIMQSGRQVFDHLVIATPYHDQASKEWVNPTWVRNIDPFLLGFMSGLPYIFVLGRWSGTGLFPLFLDMIADTINHLRINKKMLANFSERVDWHNGTLIFPLRVCNSQSGKTLPQFAEGLIAAFDEGRLFEFLREEPEKLTAGDPSKQ